MTTDTLGRIEELLRHILKVQLAPALKEYLTDDKMRDLYEQTGKLPVTQLSKKTGLSTGKISALWSRWERAGLLVKTGKSYRKPFEA